MTRISQCPRSYLPIVLHWRYIPACAPFTGCTWAPSGAHGQWQEVCMRLQTKQQSTAPHPRLISALLHVHSQTSTQVALVDFCQLLNTQKARMMLRLAYMTKASTAPMPPRPQRKPLLHMPVRKYHYVQHSNTQKTLYNLVPKRT